MKDSDFKEMTEYALSHLHQERFVQPDPSSFPTTHSDFKLLANQQLKRDDDGTIKGDGISIIHDRCSGAMWYRHNYQDPIMSDYRCHTCDKTLKLADLPAIPKTDLQMDYKTTLQEKLSDLEQVPNKLVEVYDKNARATYHTLKQRTNAEIIESRVKRLASLRESVK